jgi:hypothetical protein
MMVKKLLLAVAFSTAFAASAIAQSSYPVPPRDPPFGKGNLDNATEREPNRNGGADENIPPRDPPFGKGELRNEPEHLPSSAVTQSELPKSAKKEAKTRSAQKKDNAKTGNKPDSAPKTDTD